MNKFKIIWFGQLVSLIGSGLTSFSLGIWVYQHTGSITRFALISACATLPAVLISPTAGVIVDRWDRRTVMVLSDLAGGITTLAIAVLFFMGRLRILEIYVLVAMESIAAAFRLLSYMALLSQLVPSGQIERASGMMQLGPAAAQVVSPILAAALIGFIHFQGVLFVDFTTFIFAIGTLLLIQVPQIAEKNERQLFWREAAEGWYFITARPGLMRLLLFFVVINITYSFAQVLFTPVILSFTTVSVLGTIMSVGAFGFLGGGILVSAWRGPRKRVYGLLGCAVLYGLGLIVAGLRRSPFLITAGVCVTAFALPLMNGFSQAIWQTKTALPIQGRVFAIRQMIAWSSIPLAFFLAGPLADNVFEPLLMHTRPFAGKWTNIIGTGPGRGAALLLILNGILALLITALCYFNRRLRHLEEELPNAVSGTRVLPVA
jgi:DHA3 family macrolide efflux protein-like MFS transporter